MTVADDIFGHQEFPFPYALRDLVLALEYRPGWTFTLTYMDRGQGCKGLTLDVVTLGYNSYHTDQGQNYRVHHYFPVLPAAYDRDAWQRWLLDCLIQVESHEACEFFVVDGVHPFAPNHGPGRNPYVIHEYTTDEQRRTRFTGEVKDQDG